jgi:exosortase family protein XrtF
VLQNIKDFYNEFKPAILFLLRFVVTFSVLSLGYGIWVEGYAQVADPITINVAGQVRAILSWFYDGVTSTARVGDPSMDIHINGKYSISVFEGCNGVAIFNLFISFIVGFWGGFKKLVWFGLLGLGIIHISNLVRLLFLAQLALTNSPFFHFTHKYLFTLSIYGIVLILWYLWMNKVNPFKKAQTTTDESA